MLPENPINQVLLGRYRIEAFLSQGGMGAVYKVWDLQRNVYLAMKVLNADPTESPDVFRHFVREAEDLKNLSHPHIVPFYGWFEDNGLYFLLEDYINGPTLGQVLRQRGALPLAEALEYLRALSAALSYAHHQGVVHADVKPANVMRDVGGRIYLMDFGISRHLDSTTTTALGSAGTPAYMAPEQIRGERLTPAADIYALGVLFFEMVTGRRPFKGDEAGLESYGDTAGKRIMAAHLHLAPPDPRSLNPRLPAALTPVLFKALAKDPAERYATTMDFYTAAAAAAASAAASADRQARESAAVFGPLADPGPSGQQTTTSTTINRRVVLEKIPPGPSAPPQQANLPPEPALPGAQAARRRNRLLLVGLLLVTLLLVGLAIRQWLYPPLARAFLPPGDNTPRPRVVVQPATRTARSAPPAASATAGAAPPAATLTGAPANSPTPAGPAATLPPTLTSAPPSPTAPPTGRPQPSATQASIPPTGGGDSWTSPVDGMTLVRIPAGPFQMGSNSSPWKFESPEHTVDLDTFWIDQIPVTNARFARFVAATHTVTAAETNGGGYVSPGSGEFFTSGADWRHPTGPQSTIDGKDNYPVVQVTWDEAQAYCTWAGRRLPTEAEWEKAARGTDGRLYPWGSQIDCAKANFSDGNNSYCVGHTTPVDAYPGGASPYGVLDMTGNTWDWVADWYQADYYSRSPEKNPTGPPSGDKRVHRGGAWYNFNLQVQAPYRYGNPPGWSFSSVGFRCGMNGSAAGR